MRRERSGEIGERRQGMLPSTGYTDRAHAKPLNPWQRFLLERLHRLVALKEEYDLSRNREEWLANALGRAIYSTLRDCVEAGIAEEAKAVLRQARASN